MTTDELLRDIRERCDRGMRELSALAVDRLDEGDIAGALRLTSKAEGVGVVRDWLRSYE